MNFNNRKYSAIKKEHFADALAEGFNFDPNDTLPPISTDGEWVISCRGPNTEPSACCSDTLPSYAPQECKDFLTANGYLDFEHMQKVMSIKASARGASDGYWYEDGA